MKDLSHIPFQKSAHNSDSNLMNENNDCTVRAIATIFDIEYLIARAVLESNGRRNGKGTYRGTTYKTIETLCKKLYYTYSINTLPIPLKATDIAYANRNNADARILMFTRKHVTCFVNGKLHDTFIDDRKVTEIISFTKNQNISDMATSIKYMTTEARSKLTQELSEKIARKSFTVDKERDKAIHLLQLLSKYEASDATEIAKADVFPDIEFKF